MQRKGADPVRSTDLHNIKYVELLLCGPDLFKDATSNKDDVDFRKAALEDSSIFSY